MKKLKLLGMLILLTLFVTGCASASFKKVAFIAVDNTKTVYEMAGPALAMLYKEGKITLADRDKAIDYGHQFAAKWELANKALKAYQRVASVENKDTFQVTLSAMQEMFKLFQSYYFSLTQKEVK